MKTKILRILKNTKDYVSGQELCQQLGVSRTAVWKVMQQLKEEGYVIDAVNNRGYVLSHCPDDITSWEIGSQLKGKSMFQEIHYLPSVDSTNNYARLLSEQSSNEGIVVVTDLQTAGKGRRGRTWLSPSKENIMMSFVLRPTIEPMKASMLTLVAAMAVKDAIQKQGIDTVIKWPNDLVVDQKKICGILTEMSSQMDYINYVVIGIGINVHQKAFDDEISSMATSLDLAKGAFVRRSEVIADILTAFEKYYQLFLQTEDLSLLKDAYNKNLVNIGKEVQIISAKEIKEGISGGIDDDGSLIVTIDGKTEHIISGEVSIRGLYGYV